LNYYQVRVTANRCRITLTCYAGEGTFTCKANNISPNVWTTHATGATSDDAGRIMLENAWRKIANTAESLKQKILVVVLKHTAAVQLYKLLGGGLLARQVREACEQKSTRLRLAAASQGNGRTANEKCLVGGICG
jgi:hypothetical protein